MKKIKLNFRDFWKSFDKENNIFTVMLRRHFEVEISDNPDFVICSNRPENGVPFSYIKDKCVRIMVMGENISPDFTSFDYVVGFDFIEFGDRYMRLPYAFLLEDGGMWIPKKLSEEQAEKILASKEFFCNFIYGHASSHGVREKLFEELNKYKKVISPGRYLNNMGTSGCTWREKTGFVKKSKFTIACDSIHYPGFVTEKITAPLSLHSIPVYFGSTKIEEDFNTKSFIECKSESDIEETVEKVIDLDRNDKKYIEMLCECPLKSPEHIVNLHIELEKFLVHIFEQEPNEAYRRVRYFAADTQESAMER